MSKTLLRWYGAAKAAASAWATLANKAIDNWLAAARRKR